MAETVVFSDGGGERSNDAAGACIIESPVLAKRVHLLTYLGGATNNESEITAGLLGFSFLRLIAKHRAPITAVRWVSDSEYTLKSATSYIVSWQRNGWRTADKKPVKNKGLWQAYLALVEAFSITPQHVRGHTGHPENEACDQASTWARRNGRELFEFDSQPQTVRIDIDGEEIKWLVVDGRPFLDALREDGYSAADFLTLEETLLKAKPLRSLAAADQSVSTASVPKRSSEELLKIVKKLKTVHAQAEKLKDNPDVAPLLKDLTQLLKKHASL